ncbi:MAG: tetratricopeptide repeat domain protein [Nitrospirales bacterium]|nr:MAG: tetratricopeptide repeat domain protein [Nitrospirales bacterium]
MTFRCKSPSFIMVTIISIALAHGVGFVSQSLAQKADADVLVAKAVLAYDDERYGEASNLLNRALELDPQDARGWYYKGLVHLAQKRPELAIDPLERCRELRPDDIHCQYQLGVAYFTEEQFDKAKPLFDAVHEQQPDLDNLNYYVGFLRYREKQYQGAVDAFNQEKSKDPNIQQLSRFYKGLALGVLGLSTESISELEQAQRTLAVSPLTQASIRIRESLAAGQALAERKRLRLQVSLGGFYDDNIPANPDPVAEIPAAGQSAIIDTLRRRQASGPGMLASVLADYSFLRHGPYEATATYSFFQTLNFNSLDSFNIQNHLVGLSGFYRGIVPEANLPYQLGVQYTYDYLFLDMDAFLARHTPTVSATVVGPTFGIPAIGNLGNLTTLLYRFQAKTFFREASNSNPAFASESRDAFNNMLGFIHAFRFAEDKFLLRIGYQYDNESTDGSAFSYEGDRLLAGAQVTLPWGIEDDMTLRYDYDVHWRDYKNAQTLFTDRNGVLRDRYDKQQTHLVQLVVPLPNKFSLTFQYQGIRNKSRTPIYDYSKNVWTGIVTWAY